MNIEHFSFVVGDAEGDHIRVEYVDESTVSVSLGFRVAELVDVQGGKRIGRDEGRISTTGPIVVSMSELAGVVRVLEVLGFEADR